MTPDLVVCDLHMPRGGGIAVVQRCAPVCPIVILTVSEAESDLLEAVAAGAAGYLVKTAPSDALRTALAKAAAGEPVFSPALAALVFAVVIGVAAAVGWSLTARLDMLVPWLFHAVGGPIHAYTPEPGASYRAGAREPGC